MKIMFILLAIVVLIASNHAEPEDDDGSTSVLGPKLTNAIPAKGINTNQILFFRGINDNNAIHLHPMYAKLNEEEHDKCKTHEGFEMNNGETTFCVLAELSIKKFSDGTVRMVKRFFKYGNNMETVRVEIPISEISEEEASPEYKADPENVFVLFDVNQFGHLTELDKLIPYDMQPFGDILEFGLESAPPTPVEGFEEGAETFVTRSIRLPPEDMAKLWSLLP